MIGKNGNGNGEFKNPYGVAFDSKNKRMLISDGWNHRIQAFDLEGKFLSKFGKKGSAKGEFKYSRQLCIHPSTDNIIVADDDNNRLQMFTNQFNFVTLIGQHVLKNPFAVDCSLLAPYNIASAE